MPTRDGHYRRPGWFTRNVFNKTVAGLTRAGHQRPRLPGPGGQGAQERPAPPGPRQPAHPRRPATTWSRPGGKRSGCATSGPPTATWPCSLGRRRDERVATEVTDARQGAGPAGLPEALEGRSRRVLRRGRARTRPTRSWPPSPPATRCSRSVRPGGVNTAGSAATSPGRVWSLGHRGHGDRPPPRPRPRWWDRCRPPPPAAPSGRRRRPGSR